MARTDKDRPWWVARHQDGFPIEHDHRNGLCIEETINDSRPYFRRRSRHHRSCAKYVTVEWNCTKDDPYRYRDSWLYGIPVRIDQECWTWRCRCDVRYRHQRHRLSIDCPTWGRVQCEGHSRRERDDSIPCVCDEWDPIPTCTPGYRYDYHYTRGGPPADYRRTVYHGPERRRERDTLREMAKDYNANYRLDDGDFFNRQARSGARWMWW